MCGIAGIVGRAGPGNRDALERMSRAMVHRGPDAAGAWESPPDAEGRSLLLAHRRLSILDLSAAGAQPMVDRESGAVLVYNGEVYNYLDLRRDLEASGRQVRSTGDTEVVLGELCLHGADALASFRGMFALACWNPSDQSLLLARDPLGMKPLYVATNPDPAGSWSMAFASEVRALLASGLLPRPRLDPAAVASVLWNGFVVGPGTAVEGIGLLHAGEARLVGLDGRERWSRTFWTAAARSGVAEEDAGSVGAAIRESVRLHLASDVPLAVFLSGGVDSSAIANLATQVSPEPIHTFTLAFEEEAFDEGRIARRVATALGTRHHEIVLTEGEFLRQLESAVASLDQPTFDGLNAFYMSRAVREAGFTVALAGTGGDELFGGYTSFRDLPVLLSWARRTRSIPARLKGALARAAAGALSPRRGAVPPQVRWAKLGEMVGRGDDLLALYQLAYALFLPSFQEELAGGRPGGGLVDGLPVPMRETLLAETRGRTPLSGIAVLEQRLFLGERLLRDNDVASMAASIEQRLPLVDRWLFERVDAMPDEARFLPSRRKEVLRRAGLAGLDPAIFERPKSGFVLPFDRWLREGLRASMDEVMRDPSAIASVGLDPEVVARLWKAFVDGAPGIYWSRVWAIFVLVRWCHRQGVFL